MQLQIQEFNDNNNQNAGDGTDDNGAQGINHRAGGRNGNQAGQRSVQTHGDIGLTVADPGEQHCHAGGNRRGNGGGNQNLGQLGDAGSGSAVKSIPSEPENEATSPEHPASGCGREWREPW